MDGAAATPDNCGASFAIQIFPSFPYASVVAPADADLFCNSDLNDNVGPYYICSIQVSGHPTRIDFTSRQTPLTGAGEDFMDYVH